MALSPASAMSNIGLATITAHIQDPFFPQDPALDGPAFLDSEACLCAYRVSPVSNSEDLMWTCIGNQTEGITITTRGMWYKALNSATLDENSTDLGPIWSASNGPDTSEALMYDAAEDQLVRVDQSETGLSIYDAVCTGINQTTFSTAFYRTVEQEKNEEIMTDAIPCWRGLAAPVQLVTVDVWAQDGCPVGLLCQNNTFNSLPQYCPPIDQCQKARLTGVSCQLNGSNIGMGPFEPVICQGGFYCPSGGMQKLRCPSGHYCQPGSTSPTPCGVGSRCPEGSTGPQLMIPFGILIAIDALLILAMVLLRIRRRPKKTEAADAIEASEPKNSGRSLRRKITQRLTGYKTLADESEPWDNEDFPPALAPGISRSRTGFQAALSINRGRRVEDAEEELTPELKTFVQSMRKATDAARFGLSFQYNNLSFQPKGMPRPILQNVTGSINRSSLTAVMGGSGAGKSTFVNVLMGKTTNTGGSVTVNNVPNKIKRYKKLIGYVPQDDVVLPELTVYENIYHSARVRLARTWTAAEIRAHVDSVIECLELTHRKDSLVGSIGKPVISGGQRKRVSIGMELAAAPMAIFLDEPTSGLDATAASSIMRTLKAIARLGISVIVIIHQPRMEIFEMIDDLILLANGQIIYEGPEEGVQNYFETLRFQFPPHANWGDVVTDIITGNGRPYKKAGKTSNEWLIEKWAGSTQNAQIREKHSMASISSISSSSDEGSKTNHRNLDDPAMLEALKKRGAPRHKQVWLCLRRALVQQWRDKSALWFELILSSIAAFLLGLAQHGKKGIMFRGLFLDNYAILSTAVDIQSAPQFSLLMGVAIGLISSAPGVRAFSEEMLLHRRESEAGHSRVAYFMAKVLAVLPRMMLACFHFTTITLVLSTPIIPWGIAFLSNLCYFWCIYGLASIISMIAKRENAPLLATMSTLVMGILCGAAPTLASVRKWHMEWLWRIGPGVWFTEIWFGQLVAPSGHVYQTALAQQATGLGLDLTWRNIGVLVAIGVAYRLLAYVGLIFGQRMRI